MHSADLYNLLDRDPCPILRLHMIGGMTFELRDPDAVVVGRDCVEVLLPRDGSNLRDAVINLDNILWIEVLTESHPPD